VYLVLRTRGEARCTVLARSDMAAGVVPKLVNGFCISQQSGRVMEEEQ
jgi:hypothetical protein